MKNVSVSLTYAILCTNYISKVCRNLAKIVMNFISNFQTTKTCKYIWNIK